MLGAYFRVIVFNNTTQSSSATAAKVTVRYKGWYISTTGVPTWIGQSTVFSNAGAIASAAFDTADATAVNNGGAANPCFGGEFEIVYTTNANAPTGLVSFLLQRSVDSGTTWPDNVNGDVGEVLGTISPTSATTTYTNVVEYD